MTLVSLFGRPNLPREGFNLVVITFPDKDTRREALGFLLGRFSGKALKSGEVIIPEEALEEQNFAFTVKGKASYEQQTASR
jgi:hypothetical protein